MYIYKYIYIYCIYTCIYIYIYVHIHTYIYIYICFSIFFVLLHYYSSYDMTLNTSKSISMLCMFIGHFDGKFKFLFFLYLKTFYI